MSWHKDVDWGFGLGGNGIGFSYASKSIIPSIAASIAPVISAGFNTYGVVKQSNNELKKLKMEVSERMQTRILETKPLEGYSYKLN